MFSKKDFSTFLTIFDLFRRFSAFLDILRRFLDNFRRRGSETENLDEDANENLSPTTVRTTVVHYQCRGAENGNTPGTSPD